MKSCLICFFMAIMLCSASAQYWDTLLMDLKSISYIYPLEDETFILVGEGRSVTVTRIDGNVIPLWTTALTEDTSQILRNAEVRIIPGRDSFIHVSVFQQTCDFIPAGISMVYTLDFDGDILDMLEVPFEHSAEKLIFLSGNDHEPRCAVLLQDRVLLYFASGDTLFIRHEDPLYGYSRPEHVDICPSGILTIIWISGVYSRHKPDQGVYTLDYRGFTWAIDLREVYCLSDEKILVAGLTNLSLHRKGTTPIFSQYYDVRDSHGLRWKHPYLYIIHFGFGEDSLFLMDTNLHVIHKEPVIYGDGTGINDYAIRGDMTFGAGSTRSWPFVAHLESRHHITQQGPRYYDVELVSIEPEPYTSATWIVNCGTYFRYKIPKVAVTIRNHSEAPISELWIRYDNSQNCCHNLVWERHLTGMDLEVGSAGTFILEDIEFLRRIPFYPQEKICLELYHPDRHGDDYPGDNWYCVFTEDFFIPTADPEAEVRHYPDPAGEALYFISSTSVDFDITIQDFQGRAVLTRPGLNSSGRSVDISMLPPGMYMLQYRFHTSGKAKSVKFVKAQ